MSHPALDLARRALLLGAVAAAGILALDACSDAPTAPSPEVRGAKSGGTGKPGSTETVLFAGTRNGNMDIYAMNADGSNVRRITTDTLEDVYPDFAPDNRKLVFVRMDDQGQSDLYVVSADGRRETRLTQLGTAWAPRFSPDGSKIAFEAVSTDAGGHDIYTINADGTGLHRLTYESASDRLPTWSPDGQKIAFQSDRGGLPYIWVMGADGLNVQVLMQCYNLGCGEPIYSPVGNKIAVTDIGNGNVFVLDVDAGLATSVGSAQQTGISSHSPAWTKDGTRVLFSSDRGIERRFEIYVGTPGNYDASSIQRLTVFAPGDAQTPAYSH
jgi:Tol biopolymer transport system component